MNVERLKEMTDEELEKFISDNDHNEEYDDEELTFIHIQWNCEKCEAETEKERRYQLAMSKKSGNLPLIKNRIAKSIFAGDVKIGDYARYLSRPGTSDYPYEYAECVAVWYDPNLFDKTTIEWRKTNTDDKPFSVIYDSLDKVNIIRSL